MALAAGARLGPYERLGLIGAGGMGEISRARDTRLDHTVAIQVLPPSSPPIPTLRQAQGRPEHGRGTTVARLRAGSMVDLATESPAHLRAP